MVVSQGQPWPSLPTCRHRDANGRCNIDGLPCVEVCEYWEPDVRRWIEK